MYSMYVLTMPRRPNHMARCRELCVAERVKCRELFLNNILNVASVVEAAFWRCPGTSPGSVKTPPTIGKSMFYIVFHTFSVSAKNILPDGGRFPVTSRTTPKSQRVVGIRKNINATSRKVF